jgi:hypothetical protein
MTGRPPRFESAAKRRTFRATDVEWALWKKAARAVNKSVSEWLRQVANKNSSWIPKIETLTEKHRKARR